MKGERSEAFREQTTVPTIRVSTRRYTFQVEREPQPTYPVGSTAGSPRDAFEIALHVIGADIAECLISIFLDSRRRVTGYAEIYANWSTSPDVRDIYTLDFAVAWVPIKNFQLDAGINIGLVSATTPYQIYMGISQRF